MKKMISMLTASALFAVLLTGCGVQQEANSVPETTAPEIHISTIQVETQENVSSPPVETSVPETVTETETVPPLKIISSETSVSEPETGISAMKTDVTYEYQNIDFDKAVFAAMLDGIAGDMPTSDFFVTDPDRDGDSEFLVSLAETSYSSRNIIAENMLSAGIYYYNATGIENDFYVIDPTTGNVYLNENTRSETGEYIISREYFEWSGSKWRSACMLYKNNCYWNYENVTEDVFLKNADSMVRMTAEDIFNLSLSGTPESVADAFYQYLSKSFKLEHPIEADIDGDGHPEQVLFVQNLFQRWCVNVRNLYPEEDETRNNFNTESLSNMHTTCFVIDSLGTGRVRIRSENFDRRYRFAESGGRLFAYDDTNIIQTLQYSTENDDYGKHFLSVAMMMG